MRKLLHTQATELCLLGVIVFICLFLSLATPRFFTLGNAFDLLEQLAPANFKVIFLTAYEKHAIRAIKFGALDYLLKPLDETELQAAITRIPDSRPTTTDHYRIAQQRFKQGTAASRIVLNSQKDSLVVELQDIMYCHSHAGYTTFHLSGNKKIITSRHLKEYEDILPASSFVRPHKSYLVNSSYVSKFQKDGMLVLKDGTAIPVAVRRRYTITGFLNHI